MTIKKTGDKYTVYSESGKRLSKPSSKESAKKRLAQIEAFKHMKKSFNEDVGKVDVSASALTLKVDSEKKDKTNRINIDTDAYKAFIGKGVELGDGIADYDRFLMGRKEQLKKMKRKDHFHDLSMHKGYYSGGFVKFGYGIWLKK